MPDRERERDDGDSSWVESRRLIISQLRSMDEAIRSLSDKIETMQEKGRDRASLFEAQVTSKISDLHTRMAMMEVRAKMWGGVIGFLGGGAASAILDVLIGKLTK